MREYYSYLMGGDSNETEDPKGLSWSVQDTPTYRNQTSAKSNLSVTSYSRIKQCGETLKVSGDTHKEKDWECKIR